MPPKWSHRKHIHGAFVDKELAQAAKKKHDAQIAAAKEGNAGGEMGGETSTGTSKALKTGPSLSTTIRTETKKADEGKKGEEKEAKQGKKGGKKEEITKTTARNPVTYLGTADFLDAARNPRKLHGITQKKKPVDKAHTGLLLIPVPSSSLQTVPSASTTTPAKTVNPSATSLVRQKPSAILTAQPSAISTAGLASAIDTEADIATEDAQTTMLEDEGTEDGEKKETELGDKDRKKLTARFGDADEAAKMRAKKDTKVYEESKLKAELFATSLDKDAARLSNMNTIRNPDQWTIEILNDILPTMGAMFLFFVLTLVFIFTIRFAIQGIRREEPYSHKAITYSRHYQIVRFSANSTNSSLPVKTEKCKTSAWRAVKKKVGGGVLAHARMVTVKMRSERRLPFGEDCPPSLVP